MAHTGSLLAGLERDPFKKWIVYKRQTESNESGGVQYNDVDRPVGPIYVEYVYETYGVSN